MNRRCRSMARWLGAATLGMLLWLSPLLRAGLSGDTISLPREFALPVPLYELTSPWNQPIGDAEVLPTSDQQILALYRVLRGDNRYLHPQGEPPPTTWPYADINYDDYAVAIAAAGSQDASVYLCDYKGQLGWTNPKLPIRDAGGPVIVRAPAGTVRPAGPEDTDADGHLVLYDVETGIEYDYWQATTVRTAPCQSLGGGRQGTRVLETGTVDWFDVRGPGANPATYFSARATGVPLLAGLILPEDVTRGRIDHALAVAVPGLRNLSPDHWEPLESDWFSPTSTTETDYYSTDPHAMAAGQRLHIRESLVDDEGQPLDESTLAPITRLFIETMRTYGAYVIDNAGGFTFYAEDVHTANLDIAQTDLNALVGRPASAALDADETAWQVAIETLNRDLERIPFAYGPWSDGQDPATAAIQAANYQVMAPATPPAPPPTHRLLLPLILRH